MASWGSRGCVVMLAAAACSVPNPYFGMLPESASMDGTGAGTEVVTSTTSPSTGDPASGGMTVAMTASDETSSGDPPTSEPTSEPGGLCGDGVLDDGEGCDDGNADDSDACLANCAPAVCGDGVVHEGVEACDDGNLIDEDGCTVACAPTSCGDGVVQGGEQCDDGNLIPDDDCTDKCLLPKCGDGVVHANEQCDDANDSPSDECVACVPASCGDGQLWENQEACDDGLFNGSYGMCAADCKGQGPFCGDLVVNGPEGCDDGNNNDADGCSNACIKAGCGDGSKQDGEECDDGNNNDGDGCSSGCKYEGCGDGVVTQPEQCDDGNEVNTDGCTTLCKAAICGDNFLYQGVEACDDGNNVDSDACTSSCKLAECGDGVIQLGVEQCDDGNSDNIDECLSNCKTPYCGDGVVQNGEACDDAGLPGGPCGPGCALMVSVTCGDGVVDPGEECDGQGGPLGKYSGQCSGQCLLKSCLRVVNTPEVNVALSGNQWLNECAAAGGDKVLIALFNSQGSLVYAAEGNRPVWPWSSQSLTAGDIDKSSEWNVGQHKYTVPMTGLFPDQAIAGALMLTSQPAFSPGMPACSKALGDGYGIGLFSDVGKPSQPRLLVMGARGGVSGAPRAMEGFGPASEIAFFNKNPMDVCPSPSPDVSGFTGTFVMSVF